MPIISGGSNGAPEVIAELRKRDRRELKWKLLSLVLGIASLVLALIAFVPH